MLGFAGAKLRLENECAFSGDHGARLDASENLDAATAALARSHGGCLEAAVHLNEHDIAAFHRLDGTLRDDDAISSRATTRRDPDPAGACRA